MKTVQFVRLALGWVVATTCVASLAQVVVPASASFQLNGASLDLGGSSLISAGNFAIGAGQVFDAATISILPGGTVDGGSGAITLFGDWSNLGVFSAASGTVNFVDGPVALSNIVGSSTFQNANFSSAAGKTYSFASGSTQSVGGLLTILGTSSQGIQFKSSTAGQFASINLQPAGSQTIDFVGVSNVHAIGQHLAPTKTNDGGSGDDIGWFGNNGGGGTGGGGAIAAPIGSPLALLLLGLGLIGLAFRFGASAKTQSF